MKIQSFRDLIVWQKSIELSKQVFLISKKLPKDEQYTLGGQMKRAAISIPSNIAERHARQHTKEYINFLSIANGSAAELETQLIIVRELKIVNDKDMEPVFDLIHSIQKMLISLQRKLRN